MPTQAQRKAAAKKAAATRKANAAARAAAAPTAGPAPEVPTPSPRNAPHGPRRPTLADGKKPHDPVTHGDLIAYGFVKAQATEADEQAAHKAAQVPVG